MSLRAIARRSIVTDLVPNAVWRAMIRLYKQRKKQSITNGTHLVNSILNVNYRLTCKAISAGPIC
jgi:hypothetical protein